MNFLKTKLIKYAYQVDVIETIELAAKQKFYLVIIFVEIACNTTAVIIQQTFEFAAALSYSLTKWYVENKQNKTKKKRTKNICALAV